jgi:hypothetical protein
VWPLFWKQKFEFSRTLTWIIFIPNLGYFLKWIEQNRKYRPPSLMKICFNDRNRLLLHKYRLLDSFYTWAQLSLPVDNWASNICCGLQTILPDELVAEAKYYKHRPQNEAFYDNFSSSFRHLHRFCDAPVLPHWRDGKKMLHWGNSRRDASDR